MATFILSRHAIEQMNLRGITAETVFAILENPDKIELEGDGQLIYQKAMFGNNDKEYLIRVFVNSNKDPNLVKTVYRTTKFSKYQ